MLDWQLAGQGTGAPCFFTMKGEREHKTVVFNESNVLNAKID